jgi:DNA-binding beta-propeller fold protein YncE
MSKGTLFLWAAGGLAVALLLFGSGFLLGLKVAGNRATDPGYSQAPVERTAREDAPVKLRVTPTQARITPPPPAVVEKRLDPPPDSPAEKTPEEKTPEEVKAPVEKKPEDKPKDPVEKAPEEKPADAPAVPADRPGETSGTAFFRLPAPTGYVMMPDGVTLIVAMAKHGQLIYFDTVRDKEIKRVEVDFKPTCLALQERTLFAVAEGSAMVYALDAMTGKVKKEYAVGGDGIVQLACNYHRGYLYATTGSRKVYSIDPTSGAVTKTAAMGDFIAVDPVDGNSVYTGIRPPPNEDNFIIHTDDNGRFRIIWDSWGPRAAILKYSAGGGKLKFVSAQKNAAVNPYLLYLSPDGKRIMMPSGGGWRPPPSGGTGGGGLAIFSTDNLDAMIGKATGGSNVVFHATLPLGIASNMGTELSVFNSKSFIERQKIPVAKGADMRSLLLTIGGKGCKAILWNGDNPNNPEEGLHFIPLNLKDEERKTLAAVYGALPPPPATATAPNKDDPDQLVPFAASGFNDAKGINSNATPDSPFPLNKTNVAGGKGEPGWADYWPANPNARFQKEIVFEGDGALYLTGSPSIGTNYSRTLKRPLSGTFQVEQYVRLPKGGSVFEYVNEGKGTGPMWSVKADNYFRVLNGDERGDGKWIDTKLWCKPDNWYKVTVTVDLGRRTWGFAVDKQSHEEALHFRHNVSAIDGINYMTDTQAGVYIDALRFLPMPKEKKDPKQ